MDVRQNTGPLGGATVDLTAGELRALVNILGFVASGGVTAEKPERSMAARLRAELETALGRLQAPPTRPQRRRSRQSASSVRDYLLAG